ncbi:hypothetical protein [Trabulsiella odontotermitis]|uniref:hypothetical protein n=1 Tax=Trabulsiella odontotermitis TaxID=379893 RepID=UPI0006764CF1|nr:hypothetical protein [Trabulsiella odontotermitis]KNC92582.1 hypothetical protein GM30_15925 [Trabulsiella odontotermitis]
MSNKYQSAMHCISCELSCEVFPQESVRFQYCDNANFILWPKENAYLQRGLQEEYLLHSRFTLLNSFAFVDFSISNLRYFIDQDWIDRLSETGMRIIILSDRILVPLANYWLKKWGGIQGIIYADDSIRNIRYRFDRIFSGRSASDKRGKTLNDAEFSLLAFLLSGSGLQETYKLNELNISEIYIRKNRLEKKLGRNMNKIFAMISGQTGIHNT